MVRDIDGLRAWLTEWVTEHSLGDGDGERSGIADGAGVFAWGPECLEMLFRKGWDVSH